MQPDAPPSIIQLQARVAELEARLAEREDTSQAHIKLLGELLDSSLANVFAADRKMRLVAINRTARETFERYRGFVPQIGDHVSQFLTNQPDIMDRLAPVWPRVMAGEAFIDTITLGPVDAPRHYEIRCHPLLDIQQRIQGGYMFAYDITERTAEQQRLRQAEEALRQSQKMEAVGQLTGGIAHDFNNLLGSLLGALELAEQRLREQRHADTARMLELCRNTTIRAATQVQRLLAFSRQQTLMPQPIDVQCLVAGMQDLIASSTGPHIDFHDQTLAGLWQIRIDPQQLENALLNLCINARDAMARGGTLRISCQDHPLDRRQASALQLDPGDYLRIVVEDTGCGMPKDIASRALEPFFTTKPLGQGTGLGLSMAYGLMRQSGGHLCIDSTPQGGTRIHLYLRRDLSDKKALELTGAPPAAQYPRATGIDVLLVEDDPTLRMVIREVLEERGYRVQDFEEGTGALLALDQGHRPALLIIDIGLPGSVDGYHVANAYLARDECAPVLFITGYNSGLENARLASSRLTALLHKPFELALLIARVDQLLDSASHKPGTA